jgi:uncharacterized membrane protein
MHAAGFDLDMTTWLTAILLPLLGGLFWMIQGVKRDLQGRLEELAKSKSDALAAVRAELGQHRLEVARGYAPLHAIRDIDRRLSMHLVRIEQKLERVTVPR